jgi:gliding motility-associated-like protein
MRIFNRWGQEIYTSTDPTVEWDGRASGALVPDGVYTYLISAEDPCSPGELRELRGHVTLLR